ncbi:MAG TPA: thioredoxin reductase [Candidatus Woesearchaeota archaeon]|nr:thioredoxin reductase [Candidatus Woesearchaeota archaeon]
MFKLGIPESQDIVDTDKSYQVVVIGKGSAAYTAAIYSARYKLDLLIIGKEHGGAITDAHLVENYPGTLKISGTDLMNSFLQHVNKYKVPILEDTVVDIKKQDSLFHITTRQNIIIKSRSVIIATGTKRRQLDVPGSEKFLRKGISYCAICDGPFYQDKTVGVIGGSDAAASSAVLLSQYAKKVYIIYRRDKLRCEPYWLDLITNQPNIEIIYNSNVIELSGEDKLEKAKLDTDKILELQGLFIEIGSVPSSEMTKSLGPALDKSGFIVVDSGMKTNVPGIYAAGDITSLLPRFRQVVVSAAQGAIAANSAYDYIKSLKD